MAARSNALSELARFWLDVRHDCAVRESIPVPVHRGHSDIDLLAIRPNLKPFRLPSGTKIGPRVIVETKDEHDYDPRGTQLGKLLLADMGLLRKRAYVPKDTHGVKFVMLKQQHYEVASAIFDTDDFDGLFIVHALNEDVRQRVTERLQKLRIHWMTVGELVTDLESWYRAHARTPGLRHGLMGDVWHLLFGYCNVETPQTSG